MTDKKPPKPEEVQKEFEDFVRQRFGGSVQIFSPNFEQNEAQEDVDDATVSDDDPLQFNYTPREIKDYLDKYVIKQDEAKKALAIAVCDHYNHARSALTSEDYDYAKQNVLILGPTGVGKTYLVKKIADLIGVPFVKADATRFSETGYVGANVDDVIRDLVAKADGDLEKARFGIVYLDEADKIAARAGQGARDVNSRGVQFGLLRLMEDCDVDLKSGNDIHSQMQAFMEMQSGSKKSSKINTKHILFIVSGAFGGMNEIISKRLQESPIGFHRTEPTNNAEGSLLHEATTDDFLEFGFEAEFIGRLPVRVACDHLDANDLARILTQSKGSILRQYQDSFRAYGINLNVEEDGIEELAAQAAVEKTGARSLMTVCERVLRHYKFELPSTDIESITLTPSMIRKPQQELKLLLDSLQSQSLSDEVLELFSNFEQKFYNDTQIKLRLLNDFKQKLWSRSENLDEISETLHRCFEGYEHGLKLIHQRRGIQEFSIPAEALEKPHDYLENLIVSSYESKAES